MTKGHTVHAEDRGDPDDRPAPVRTLFPPLSARQRLLVSHLADLAKYLADDALPDRTDALGRASEGRPSCVRRPAANALFRRALAMANGSSLEALRRHLVTERDRERRTGAQPRADALSAFVAEVDLRLCLFRDLRVGSTD